MTDTAAHLLENVLFTFRWYKDLAERAVAQMGDAQLHARSDDEANSIAIVMKHMAGNMRSRWTDFLTTDGEKPDRGRDDEFVDDVATRDDLMRLWERGWACTLAAIEALGPEDVLRTVTIRDREHTVVEALHRQLAHYAYHVGQIVLLARSQAGREWTSLSIARGQSQAYVPRERL